MMIKNIIYFFALLKGLNADNLVANELQDVSPKNWTVPNCIVASMNITMTFNLDDSHTETIKVDPSSGAMVSGNCSANDGSQLLELKWSTTDKANTSIVLNRTITFSFTQNITEKVYGIGMLMGQMDVLEKVDNKTVLKTIYFSDKFESMLISNAFGSSWSCKSGIDINLNSWYNSTSDNPTTTHPTTSTATTTVKTTSATTTVKTTSATTTVKTTSSTTTVKTTSATTTVNTTSATTTVKTTSATTTVKTTSATTTVKTTSASTTVKTTSASTTVKTTSETTTVPTTSQTSTVPTTSTTKTTAGPTSSPTTTQISNKDFTVNNDTTITPTTSPSTSPVTSPSTSPTTSPTASPTPSPATTISPNKPLKTVISIRDITVDAFRNKTMSPNAYQASVSCPGDNDKNNGDIIPIVVGAVLAGLILVTLAAYLLGRKLQKRENYSDVE